MPHFSKYWIFQLSGWTFFALINIYIAKVSDELTIPILKVNILIALFGLLLTHAYRNYIVKHNAIIMPTEKLLRYVILGIALLSLLYNAIYYALALLLHTETFKSMTLMTFVGTYVSVYFLFSIWSAFYFWWAYIEKNRKIQLNKLTMESEMKDLELKTIRSNLQPHFIFNSLNSIRALIDEDPEIARKAITNISNILRSSITKQEPTDTLENEVKLVDDYLSLEKIRFEQRLQFIKSISPETLSIQIPTMMLQTLVENAIKHGISKLEAGGKVQLNAFFKKDDLILEVINSGTLNKSIQHEYSLGFGVSSTTKRLQLIYGDRASIHMKQQGDTVCVTIIIKLIKQH